MVWQCLGSCDGRNWRRREKPYPPSNRHESLSRQADKGNTWLLGLCLTGLRSSLLLKEFIYINNPACLLPSFRSGGIFISCESVAVMLWPLIEQLIRRLNSTNQELTIEPQASIDCLNDPRHVCMRMGALVTLLLNGTFQSSRQALRSRSYSQPFIDCLNHMGTSLFTDCAQYFQRISLKDPGTLLAHDRACGFLIFVRPR